MHSRSTMEVPATTESTTDDVSKHESTHSLSVTTWKHEFPFRDSDVTRSRLYVVARWSPNALLCRRPTAPNRFFVFVPNQTLTTNTREKTPLLDNTLQTDIVPSFARSVADRVVRVDKGSQVWQPPAGKPAWRADCAPSNWRCILGRRWKCLRRRNRRLTTFPSTRALTAFP